MNRRIFLVLVRGNPVGSHIGSPFTLIFLASGPILNRFSLTRTSVSCHAHGTRKEQSPLPYPSCLLLMQEWSFGRR
ncbi:hypothetical protein PVAP13_3KG466300 [Panicum virgatum]|uniref:Uncharacterized protein n=1 Tax=Panicum virgatum TaxID=38727 RepID=A0A8T0V2Z4_PANVG|nr:hypothetical protein PVAP13_3KG466300 [Panicum virgatum]